MTGVLISSVLIASVQSFVFRGVFDLRYFDILIYTFPLLILAHRFVIREQRWGYATIEMLTGYTINFILRTSGFLFAEGLNLSCIDRLQKGVMDLTMYRLVLPAIVACLICWILYKYRLGIHLNDHFINTKNTVLKNGFLLELLAIGCSFFEIIKDATESNKIEVWIHHIILVLVISIGLYVQWRLNRMHWVKHYEKRLPKDYEQ